MVHMRKSRCMDPKVDWLNARIDRMQAGRSLFPSDPFELDQPGEYIAMLQIAAQLNDLTPTQPAGASGGGTQVKVELREWAVNLNPKELSAGKVTFDVSNTGTQS